MHPTPLFAVLFVLVSSAAFATPRLLDADLTKVRLTRELRGLEGVPPNLWIGRSLIIGGGAAMGVGLGIGGLALFFDMSEIAQSLGQVLFGLFGASAIVIAGAVILVAGTVVLILGLVEWHRTGSARIDAGGPLNIQPQGALARATAPDRPASMPTVEGRRPGGLFEVARF